MRSLLLVLLLFVSSVQEESLTGHVVGVADGDTITVLDNTNTQLNTKSGLLALMHLKRNKHLAKFLKNHYLCV